MQKKMALLNIKWKRQLHALLLCAVIFLTGCHSPKAENSKRPLKINIGSDPQTLDPRKARSIETVTLMRLLFDGLTRISPQEKPELALAEKVVISEDLTTYTFTLRHTEWSNGDPVTASDFVYSWTSVLSPLFPCENASQLYIIKNGKEAKMGRASLETIGVRALDRYTLEVTLERPAPYFLELLAQPTFFPINSQWDVANPKWMETPSSYVSNGPFRLMQWRHQDALILQKSKNYWDEKVVKLSEIQLVMVSQDAEYQMFEKKELDWAGSPLSILPLDALPQLKATTHLHAKPFLGTYFLRVNTCKAPLSDARVRRALAYAIDRKGIVVHALQGNHSCAMGLVPASMQLQKEPLFAECDVERARQEFEEGLRHTKIKPQDFPSLTLIYPSGERNHLIAQAIQQQWREVFGLKVHLQGLEKKVYYDRLAQLDYDLATGSWIADFDDPINFLEVFKFSSASTNNTGWESPQYISLLDASYKTDAPSQRTELMRLSEQLLMDEMPLIPIFHYNMLYVSDAAIKGVVLPAMGSIDFKWAHFEEEAKAR